MKCATCSAVLPAGDKFCGQCGSVAKEPDEVVVLARADSAVEWDRAKPTDPTEATDGPVVPGQIGSHESGVAKPSAPAPARSGNRALVVGTIAAVVVILGAALFIATRPSTTTTASDGANAEAADPSRGSGGTTKAAQGVDPNVSGSPSPSPLSTHLPSTTSTTAPPSPVRSTGSGEFALELTHPSWGRVTLATHDDNSNGPAWFTITGSNGAVLFRYDTPSMYVLRPAGAQTDGGSPVSSAVDKTGHIFLDYNPGRYNGVIILSPTGVGFENFRTLPASGEYATRFYSGVAKDVDGDGTYEVEVTTNDCTPSCAAGTNTVEVFRWNGSDYVPT